MHFQSRTYLRLEAMAGSVIGILAMIAAISAGWAKLGAVLAVICAGIGCAVGNGVEKRKD